MKTPLAEIHVLTIHGAMIGHAFEHTEAIATTFADGETKAFESEAYAEPTATLQAIHWAKEKQRLAAEAAKAEADAAREAKISTARTRAREAAEPAATE